MSDASTIPEAKAFLIEHALRYGYRQDIQRGSFEKEHHRYQLTLATMTITNPLFDMVPVPPTGTWVPEQTLEACEKYYHNYILGGAQDPNEEYTYADRMNRKRQLEHVVEMLRSTPETNQAVIAICAPEDAYIKYPACLRDLHFKVIHGKLNMYTFWRSHDLYGGFGINMVGLAMLFRDIADMSGLKCSRIFYISSGSHVYSMVSDFLQPRS